MQDFHYLLLSATGCVGIAYNCFQYVDSSLGINSGVVVNVLELFFSPEVGDEGTSMDTKRVVSLDDSFFVRQD